MHKPNFINAQAEFRQWSEFQALCPGASKEHLRLLSGRGSRHSLVLAELNESAFMQETCHDLLRDHDQMRKHDCLPDSEVRKRIGSPLGLRTYNPAVNNFQSL